MNWMLLGYELRQILQLLLEPLFDLVFCMLIFSEIAASEYTMALPLPVFSHSFALSLSDLICISLTLKLLCPFKGPLFTEL